MSRSVLITAFTHRGRVRHSNEDTIVVGGWVSTVEMSGPVQTRHEIDSPLLCAVADGMGGHRAGDVASRYVARRIAAETEHIAEPGSVAATLRAIDQELFQAMQADDDFAGMGTTIVGMLIASHLVWFNVGDSRLYRCDHGRLTQISVDDSPPGPRNGLLTQCLGGGSPPPKIEPHVGQSDIVGSERFLLCTDGLTDMLDQEAMEECLALQDPDAVAELFNRAMRAGGTDNISIVLVSTNPS